jgi:hypothetical protein
MSTTRRFWHWGPVVFLRRVALWAAIAAFAYALHRLWGPHRPAARLPVEPDGIGTAGYLFLFLASLAILLVRGYQSLGREDPAGLSGPADGQPDGTLAPRHRLLSFRERAQDHPSHTLEVLALERESERLKRRVAQLTSEAKVAGARFRATLEAVQAESTHFRQESDRLAEENAALRASLAQARIDLAFLTERVNRFLSRRRPTLLNRVRDALLGHDPSRDVQELARGLESLGGPRMASAGQPARRDRHGAW